MLAFLERKSNKWRISSKTNLATLMLTSNVPCKHISLFFDETYEPFGFQGNPACYYKFTVRDLLVIVFAISVLRQESTCLHDSYC